MTREVLFEKMKDLPNPPCRINLIQQVWEIMNSETEELKKENTELKAERLQWHYLIEDPNDLPKKEGPYWVCVRDGRYKENGSWEWTSKPVCKIGVWMDGVFGINGGPPVIAWCETPKYVEE